ncbi:hypothetical protein CLPU_24c00020 [Gottschalkia purinilytica]|uniref:Uncharacterized protein n=1 Tax=Gottschalkia purinilytica TaxID=1503 RepID=A0A0L0W6F0_GOTPU|nr:hypothetical protein CLPU_24c00020 [Gottschalkia purinilytica]
MNNSFLRILRVIIILFLILYSAYVLPGNNNAISFAIIFLALIIFYCTEKIINAIKNKNDK